jgi:hypothetical protein
MPDFGRDLLSSLRRIIINRNGGFSASHAHQPSFELEQVACLATKNFPKMGPVQ